MNSKQLFLIGGAAIVTIAVLAAAFLLLPNLLTSKDAVVLGEIHNDGDADLSLLSFGDTFNDGVEIVEDVFSFGCDFILITDDNMRHAEGVIFVPGTDDTLTCGEEDDEFQVVRMGPGDEAPMEILEVDGWLTAYVYTDLDQIIFVEDRGDQERCYLSQNGEEAERIAKGDGCEPVLDGSAVVTSDWDSDGLTLAITDTRRGEEVELLDEDPTITRFRISYDGSRIALIANDEGDISISLMDTSDGEIVTESDDDYIQIYTSGFNATENSAYAIAGNEDGMLVLLVSNANRFEEIAEAEGLQAGASSSGRYLIYQLVDEDGESEIYSYDFSRGESTLLYDGEQIEFTLLNDSDRIIILEQDDEEYTLFSVLPGGGDAVELHNADDVYNLDVATFPGLDLLFITVYGEDGASLTVVPIDSGEGFTLLDEWYSFSLARVTSNGRTLAFVGREDDGDDLTLFSIDITDDAKPVELDDDMEDIFSEMILFSRNDRELVYTVSTGDRTDDIEVRTARVDGEGSPDVIYDEAVLIAAVWDNHFNFETLSFSRVMSGTGRLPTPVDPTPPEPTDPSTPTISGRIQLGDTIMDEITGESGDYWSFDGQAGDEVMIMLNGVGGLDTVVELMNSSYELIDSNDDGGEGRNSLLIVTLPTTGRYIIRARGFSGATGSYELTVLPATAMQPTGTPVAQATPAPVDSPDSVILSIGSTVHGRTTSSEGDAWTLTIDSGSVIGIAMDAVRDMDTYLELYDSQDNLINSDDDGGDGFNSYLLAILPEAGTYTVVARGYGGDTGEYYLSVEDMSVAVQGSISLGETVSGTLVEGMPFHMWTFSGQQGDLVFISMDGFSNLDTYLQLLGPDGEQVDYDDDSGAGYNSLLMYRLQDSGTHTIIARGFSGDVGQYELTFSELSDTEGVLAYNTMDEGELTEDEIGDMWTFQGQEGDIVAISMDGAVTLEPFLSFFDSDLGTIASSEGSSTGFGPSIFWSMLPETGTYYVMAGRSFGSGAYNIMVHHFDPDDQPVREAGDTYIRTFENLLGNIDVIRGTRGDVISIAMNAIDEMDPIMGIFDSEWNFLFSDDDSGEGYNALINGFELPYSDDYYLVELALDNALGDYEISITEGVIDETD